MSVEEDDNIPVTIRILDKEYRIGCKEGEQEGLITSARYVDQRMREIRQSGRIIGSDRVAVLVALNIAHELLNHRQLQNRSEQAIGQRIRSLQKKIEVVLESEPAS